MSRPLTSFADLVLQAQQGEDYDLVIRERNAAITVLALHGGHIEPLTGQRASDLAETLARFERTTRQVQERGILGSPHRHQ